MRSAERPEHRRFWTDLAQDMGQWRTLVNIAINNEVQYNVGKFLSSCTTDHFSRRAQLHEVSTVFTFSPNKPTSLTWPKADASH
jgi:hypothetical protein